MFFKNWTALFQNNAVAQKSVARTRHKVKWHYYAPSANSRGH